MNWNLWARVVVVLVALPFAWLTAVAVADSGYLGFFPLAVSNVQSTQVFCDLVIACSVLGVWMSAQTWRHGRSRSALVGFLALTVTLGSFGPLAYVLVYGVVEQGE